MHRRLLIWLPAILIGMPFLFWLLQPWPILLRWQEPGRTAYMEARLKEARESDRDLEIRQEWVSLEELPPVLARAVLVAEDDRFFEHNGIDWQALAEEVRYRGGLPPDLLKSEDRAALRAAWVYVQEHRDELRGRSTLTQQLARNLYLAERRSFFRKGREFIVARRLEFFLPKDRILELYLNTAELGDGIFGVEAAAQAYFGRSARELNRVQAASLAATLPHPRTSNPAHRPERMAWRRDLILRRLTGEGGDGNGIPVPPPAPAPVSEPLNPLTLPDPITTLPSGDPERSQNDP